MVPVISVDQMREWEQQSWEAGLSESAVIGQVGNIIAERLALALRGGNPRRRQANQATIWALAGKGHNGDDVRLAASVLKSRGMDCRLVEVLSREIAGQVSQELMKAERDGQSPDWIIDGLFGIGLSRALEGPWAELVSAINASRSRVMAVDVPSGLDAVTGKALGGAVEADWTLTLGAIKSGLLQTSAARFVGRLEVAGNIGLIQRPDFDSDFEWVEAEDWRAFPSRRSVDSHKGTYGRLLMLAGSLGYHGAAVLAAKAAQRAMPGWIQLLTDPDCYTPVASQLTGPMVAPWNGEAHPWFDAEPTAIGAGPGLASATLDPRWMEKIRELWKSYAGPLVVDASGLNALLDLDPADTNAAGTRILTPHPGEAGRLLGCSAIEIQQDRAGALRKLSSKFGGAWIVLKGNQTLVGRAEGKIGVNSSGNPALAQGGSGDILTGYLCGLLAQPILNTPEQIESTIRYAVWKHGHAADRLSRTARAWPVERLVEKLG